MSSSVITQSNVIQHVKTISICVIILCILVLYQLNIHSIVNISKMKVWFSPKNSTDSERFCYCHSRRNKTDECHFMLNRSVLIHQPAMNVDLQSTPCLLLDQWSSFDEEHQSTPMFSIILTVWNQEENINRTLISLLNSTREIWELIIVFDQCRDKSISNVNSILKIYSNPTLIHIRLIEQETAVGETSANNIGMRATHPRSMYFILMQDDLVMNIPGWNVLLAEPIRIYLDVLAVSGRCGHATWTSNEFHYVGRCNADIDRPLSMVLKERCKFYVRDTVNRGPLLLHASRTRQLGYLDEEHYWLGDDEHDLNFRAYASHRWIVGFRPIDFQAPLSSGGSRRKTPVVQTKKENQYLDIRMWKRNQRQGALEQFMTRQWLLKDMYVTLDFTSGKVNLYEMMRLANNSKELNSTHDEIRSLCGDNT